MSDVFDKIWLVPFFPAVGAVVNGLLGKWLGRRFVGVFATLMIGLSFLVSCVLFYNLLALAPYDRHITQDLYTWVSVGSLQVKVSFLLDALSALMILVVTCVSFFIHWYSTGYMASDPGYQRYFCYLNLFVFAMLLLVLGSNFLVLFVGWEGVGLCSYLLIGFWYERKSAADAGKKAFIVNRIGDFGFLLAIFLIFATFGTLDFDKVFGASQHVLAFGGATVTWITLLLFVGAVGKSAQLPLYVWLPDAMEGPTPVSALIHAATMVTAGVYMVGRCYVLYEMAPVSMLVVAMVGAATALFAATIGLTQFDIKRVLAYSTISQLGYMFLACGVGAFASGIFHLMTHAFFKALLFLGAGSVMHGLSGELDMRKMGNLRAKLPLTHVTMLVGTLAIAGAPLFSGFFSKDEILSKTFLYPGGHPGLWAIGLLTAGLTSLYMFRLLFKTFWGESRLDPGVAEHIHRPPVSMKVALVVLAVGALSVGWLGWPHHLGGHNLLEQYLSTSFWNPLHWVLLREHLATPRAEWELMLAAVAVAAVGAGVAWAWYGRKEGAASRAAAAAGPFYRAAYTKYKVDEAYNFVFVRGGKGLARVLWQWVDSKVIDGLVVNGSAYVTGFASEVVRWTQSGLVRSYAAFFLIGVIAVLIYCIFR
jgi:NADH-quinone oxidoreductase subunit L